MALYTKYRPHDWDSLVWQDTISAVLRTSLIQNAVWHAYILTGSRGTGKTTTARILAEWVNCENLQNGNPCHNCPHCIAFDNDNMLDCIEIDGASNNGVENVRDLIEKARFEPSQWKYKIYIIDEVHMLSPGAFNALLKILEEPPDHVKFILATTEIDKVPDTIKSRSLRFDFKKITESDIIKRLQFVCKEEGIKVEKEALEIIARAARGGLRDALTLTEQNTVNNEINTEYVRSTLSLIEDSLINEIIWAIVSSDKVTMIHILDTLRQRHAEVRSLFDQILYSLRDRMLNSFAGNNIEFSIYSQIFSLFESAYAQIKIIPDGWLLIEITLLRAVAREECHGINTSKWNIPNVDNVPRKNDENGKKGAREEDTAWKVTKANIDSNNEKTECTPGVFPMWKSHKGAVWISSDAFDNESMEPHISEMEVISTEWKKETKRNNIWEDSKIDLEWKKITKWQKEEETKKETRTLSTTYPFSYIRLLEETKKVKASLVPDLKTARFDLSGNILTLIFSKQWHFNRVNQTDMKNIIAEMLQSIYTGNWKIECRLDSSNWANIMNEVF